MPTSRKRDQQMQIRTRLSISADGYVTTPDGWPALVADPDFVPGRTHGWADVPAQLRGRADGADHVRAGARRRPLAVAGLDVFVLGRDVPTEGAPVPIVTDSDPPRLLGKARPRQPRPGRSASVGGRGRSSSSRALGALTG